MLTTVNVLEVADTSDMNVNQLVAFPDTPEGNKAAEQLFVQLVRENEDALDDEEVRFRVDDGYYENGTYYVALVHSTKPFVGMAITM